MNLKEVNLAEPTSLYLYKGDRYLAVSEEAGLTILDIDKAAIANPTLQNKDLGKIARLGSLNENGV